MHRFACSVTAGVLLALCLTACRSTSKPAPPPLPAAESYPAVGSIERLDPRLDLLIAPGTPIEKLAEGFDWSEGPVWVPHGNYLLFSDVPRNTVYKWAEGGEATVFLRPSGYTGPRNRGGEPGSNGLLLDPEGRLVLCQHGDRRMARLEPDWTFQTLARFYQYRRFNSPNDAVYRSNGDLYFTDPPYGLEKLNDDPAKELMFSGVFRLAADGQLELLTDRLTFPNGIAFSPDERILYVAVSDSQRPVIMAFDVAPDGSLQHERVFFDAAPLRSGRKGLPDGLKVDRQGNLFATGPGGVLVIAPDATLLGIINTGEATANCAWGNDGSVLYITADMFLCRVRTLTSGAGTL
ncbi:MAG: SMP-30/gluconolactonase/LRE family protein [Verrucomicrobia bacterium]|nr:SMP-30/gluconolactonase/LRE family protein [Verrucomicrobiota bacterium]